MSLDQLIENDTFVREVKYLHHSLEEQEKLGAPLNCRIEMYEELRGVLMAKYSIPHYTMFEAYSLSIMNDCDPLYYKNGT